MELTIIKRDGREVPFDAEKIINAILKSFVAVDGEVTEYAKTKAENIAIYVTDEAIERTLTVDEIQDLVEKGLMATKRKDVAKAYIVYRQERDRERARNSNLIKTVKEKVMALNVQNQNANMDENSFGGRTGEASSVVTKRLALDYIVSPKSRENHLNNEIYIHDLDAYYVGSHNCLSIPFDDLLAKGFNTR